MKGVFVILDGVADEPCSALGGKTPLEFAKTPNLDWLAQRSKLDYCYTVKEGVAPESSSAVVSLLGYDPNFAPRGPLEAMGVGVKLGPGDLAFRTNFATIDDIKDGNILDSRAGRTLTTREARQLTKFVNENVKLPYKFKLYSSVQHRGVLVFKGGFGDNISDANPFYKKGSIGASGSSGKMVYSKPLDDEDDSKLSADLVNMFIRHSSAILDKHPANISRAKKGLYSANLILCRGAGSEKIRFKKLKGKWMALTYMPLERGIAEAAGMEHYSFSYPKLKGIDIYDNLYAGLRKANKNAIKMLKKNQKKYDYFYIHFKETDLPGHDNKPMDKVKMIEMIDKGFFGFLKKFIKGNKLVITADHMTACKRKAHTAGAVPVLSYPLDLGKGKSGKKERGVVEGRRFTESEGLKGKKVLGRKMLEEKLFSRK